MGGVYAMSSPAHCLLLANFVSSHQSLERGAWNAQSTRRLAFRQADDFRESLRRHTTTWTTEPHTLSSRPSEPRLHPFLNPPSLKLRQCSEDVKLEFASGRRAVDALTHRDERNAQRLEFIEQRHQMFETAT